MNLPVNRQPGDDNFPVGLRVLLVDDDPTCLTILEKMLHNCLYKVTMTNRAEVALSWLRENKNGFDIVISDVHMPGMDGFELLEHIGLEMDLPVIMISADDSKHVVMKGVTHGACDYLVKPVHIEALKNIWQHVVRKKKKQNEYKDVEQSGSWDEGDRPQKQDEVVSSPANEGSWKNSKRKSGEEEETEEKDDSNTLKKPRVVWSVELHQQFVGAVNQLGIDKAVPKKILELMNVPGLTRENVASHLQKYRLYLRRLSGVSQHQVNSPFMPQDPSFSSMSSLGGIDLQTLAATGQLSAQALAAYTRLSPTIKPGMSMPFVDQINLFSFENNKLRYGEPQQPQISNASKQMNLLHGIPTTMEPKQLAGLNQSAQTLGNMNMQANTSSSHQSSSLLMQQLVPPQSRGQILNESVNSQVSRIQPSIGQALQSNGTTNSGLPRNGLPYDPVSQAGPVVDYSVNQISELQGNSFPLGVASGITSIASKGFSQEEVSSEIKATRGFVGSYDMFSDLQQKPQEWQQLQNPNMSYGVPSQHSSSLQSSMNVSPSVMVNQSYGQSNKNEQNGNTISGKPVFSTGLENQLMGPQNIHQNLNNILVNHSSRVKAENVSDTVNPGANIYSEHYGQEDLMSALLKQQDGIGSGDFDYDEYTFDNIPV